MRLVVVSRDSFLTDAQKLCQFAPELHEVTLVTSKTSGIALPESQTFAVHAVSLGSGRIGRLRRWLAFCRAEINAPNDLVYMYYFPGCSLLRLACRRKTFVLDIRTAAVTSGRFKRYLRDCLLKLEASCFRDIAVISQGLRRKLGLFRPGVHIVPVGGDLLNLRPKKFGRLDLLYVGSTSKRRRVEDTIFAFARFYREFRGRMEMHYTIAGDSADRHVENLRRIVANEGLNEVIDLPGYVPHDRLETYLDQCNVGISYIPMTPFFEHQPPTKTFEYLLAGLPVIATSTAENARVINGRNGLLIADTPDAVYGALCEIASQRTAYDSAEIRESVANYSWENIIRNTVFPLLNRIVDTGAASRLNVRPAISETET